MRFCLLLALALVSFVVVTQADDGLTSTSRSMMKMLGEMRYFFERDPLGQKLVDLLKELEEVFQMLRKKLRTALKSHLRELVAEGK
uniref:Antigen B n=1 Tax=Echinococcus multilocularis TaxID=6211 RepID=Q867Y7_ECHMU|nr:antigen B8/1a [Echinococcus multilocularis]BAC55585.1 antigen B [Echinococcus multilocularis]